MTLNQEESAKTEVVAAYHEVLQKIKINEAKKNMLDEQKELVKDPIKEEKKRIVELVAKETPNELLKNFDILKRSLNDNLEDIRHHFIEKKKILDTLIAEIENKKVEIANLHDIEVNIDSLSALVMAQREKSLAFEKEIQEKRMQFEQDIIKKKVEWQQEEQKYIYQRDLAREKDRNRFEAAKRDLEQELAAMRHQAHKELDEREAKISISEQEFQQIQQLKEKIALFPEELRKATQRTEETITKQLTLKFEYERQLMQKEMKLYEQTIATLEAKIAMLEANISHFESLKSSFNRLLFNQMES